MRPRLPCGIPEVRSQECTYEFIPSKMQNIFIFHLFIVVAITRTTKNSLFYAHKRNTEKRNTLAVQQAAVLSLIAMFSRQPLDGNKRKHRLGRRV